MTVLSALFRRDATTYPITVRDFNPPNLAAEVVLTGGDGPAVPRVVSEKMGKTVALPVEILLSEASQGDLRDEVDALNSFLRGGTCTFEVTFQDAAAATIYDVYYADPLTPPYSRSANLMHWVKGTLNLYVSPFSRTASANLYTAQVVATPNSLALSGLAGIYRTPLTHTIASQTADDLHSAYLALAPAAMTSYLFEAESLTWGAGAATLTDATAHGGSAKKIASVTAVAATMDVAALEETEYRLIARVKVLGGETGTIYCDVTQNRGLPDVTFTRSSWHIVELGECTLPAVKVRSGVSPLVVSVKSTSATAGHEACVDWVIALPTRRGIWSWHHTTDASDCDTIHHDADDGVTYVDDVADGRYVTGNTLMAYSSEYLLVVTENAAGDAASQNAEVTIAAPGRYPWMR